MNEQMKNYLLYGIAALTVINTVLIFTKSDSGRVIDRPTSNTALVDAHEGHDHATQPGAQSTLNVDEMRQKANESKPKKPAGPPTSIAFEQMAHDFGTIKQNSENKHIFKFTNTGTNPLIIQDAKGSCGCTVPKYPKNPVAPGESGEIEVVYKPGTQQGNQTKTVTLTANTTPEQTVLKINAMVETEAPAGAEG